MNHKFKEGDKVIHQKGNVPRKGIIQDRPHEFNFYREGKAHCSLAFYGENNYFEWLDTGEQYLLLDKSKQHE